MEVIKEMNTIEGVKFIMNYRFDPEGTEITFESKLMDDYGWSLEDTERIILEYKAFMCILLETGQAAPPYLVDMAWHQHILYTRDYFMFCDDVFGRYIHHNPDREKGNSSDLFKKTIAKYEELFGVFPNDIWFYNKPVKKQNFLTKLWESFF